MLTRIPFVSTSAGAPSSGASRSCGKRTLVVVAFSLASCCQATPSAVTCKMFRTWYESPSKSSGSFHFNKFSKVSVYLTVYSSHCRRTSKKQACTRSCSGSGELMVKLRTTLVVECSSSTSPAAARAPARAERKERTCKTLPIVFPRL